jgi:hypothetical protein
MKKVYILSALLALLASGVRGEEKKAEKPQVVTSEQTACHGTAIDFVESPAKAAKLAAQQKKLVMVLHVSGYFEDPDFT